MATVQVYSTPLCPWCHKVKEFLKEHKIKFEDINVADDDKARQEMIDKTGEMGVPQTNIDGEWIVGFDEPALKKALKIK